MKLTKQSVALDKELQELFLAASKRACTAVVEEIRVCSIWQELGKKYVIPDLRNSIVLKKRKNWHKRAKLLKLTKACGESLKLTTSISVLKSDFLRMSIGRQSRKIDFSFILPKNTFGWTYWKKNSSKLQWFIIWPKFESSKFAYNGSFCGLKCSKFHASLWKQQGRKNNPMETKLGTKVISFLYFKICN